MIEEGSNDTDDVSINHGQMKRNILIGVAWPYANGYIHLGHVAGSLLAPDIFSRYHRMKGNDVLMVSGSDEHGTPITVRAQKEGKTPQEVVDFFHEQTKRDLESLMIQFDLFTRTTHPNHTEVVQDIFLTLYSNGDIYPATTTELFCENCEKFLPDRYVTGTCPHCQKEGARGDQCDECNRTYNAVELTDPVCELCGKTPQPKETMHFFLRLSTFSDRLMKFLEDKDHWKSRVRNFTRNWIQGGLRDRPITRDISWGIPVPLDGYPGKCIYVWFDAVIGYLSTSILWARESGDPDAWKRFWLEPGTRSYYFLGKDNVPFHTIIWPAMLMGYSKGKGVNYNLPYDVPANEYLRLGDKKFTKSGRIGQVVAQFMKEFNSDEVRYYLSIVMPENRDVNFDIHEFRTHVNNELVATLGNFIHRVLSFTSKNYGIIPKAGPLSTIDEETIKEIEKTGSETGDLLERCEFKNGLKSIMALASYGNRYLTERGPWRLIKTDRDECSTVMNTAFRIVKALAIYAYPYLPESMSRLQGYLGYSSVPAWDEALRDFSDDQYSMELERPKALYRVLEDPLKESGKGQGEKGSGKDGGHPEGGGKKKKKKKKHKVKPEPRPISLANVDLRVGRVLEIGDHPDADKLYVMKVDVGEAEPRTIIAGLKAHYPSVSLIGKNLVIVCNLKPVKLRGILSQGMMMAADKDDVVSFLTPITDADPGERVTGHLVEEVDPIHEMTIDEFFTIPMVVRKIVRVQDDGFLMDTEMVIRDSQQLQGDPVGIEIVVAQDNILGTSKGPISPERVIGPGASIR